MLLPLYIRHARAHALLLTSVVRSKELPAWSRNTMKASALYPHTIAPPQLPVGPSSCVVDRRAPLRALLYCVRWVASRLAHPQQVSTLDSNRVEVLRLLATLLSLPLFLETPSTVRFRASVPWCEFR